MIPKKSIKKDKAPKKKTKKKQNKNKEVLVHKDVLDEAMFELYMTDDNVEIAYSSFENDGIKIYIGTQGGSLSEIIANVFHELMESYLYIIGKRFVNTKMPRNYEAVECTFAFNHAEFQMMIEKIVDIFLKFFPDKMNKYFIFEKEKPERDE